MAKRKLVYDDICGWPYSKPLIYDEFCGWPYAEPYGMVPAPKVKRVRKRKPKKSGYASALTARPPKSFAATFTKAAMEKP